MIKLLITGGTIDKDYDEITGKLVFSKTHIPEMLRQSNCQVAITEQVLMLKDSLEITEKDRQIIVQACIDSSENKIVITHGTDTMVLTAQALENHPKLKNKTIILTGAMRPFKLGNSDALFNLGTAFAATKIARGGAYIAMNGKLFPASNVLKNTDLGIFIKA